MFRVFLQGGFEPGLVYGRMEKPASWDQRKGTREEGWAGQVGAETRPFIGHWASLTEVGVGPSQPAIVEDSRALLSELNTSLSRGA